MKKNKKLKVIGFALFSFLSIGTLASCSLYDKIKEIITGTENDNVESTGEEFIKGTSFLNYDGVKGLKDTEYTLTASVTPANHTAPIIWTSDFPEFVSVVAGDNDTATIIRHEDYRGYVRITASIDGLSATCNVSCVDNVKIKSISLDQAPHYSYNGKYYWNDVVDSDVNYSNFSVNVSYTSTTCSTTNIANFNEGDYFNTSIINTSTFWIYRWESMVKNFITIDSELTKSSGNPSFELQSDNTYLLKEKVYLRFNDNTSDYDYTVSAIDGSFTLSFIEYVVATSIKLDETKITI
ncbi:MAG: hypothetical protein ACI311_06770 [Bacilli bacterium]